MLSVKTCYESIFTFWYIESFIQNFDWMCEESSFYFETIIFQNMITWSFSKNSLNSRTFLLELFFAFRLNYFKNSLYFPFFAEFLSAEMVWIWTHIRLTISTRVNDSSMKFLGLFPRILFSRIFLVSNVPKTILKPNTNRHLSTSVKKLRLLNYFVRNYSVIITLLSLNEHLWYVCLTFLIDAIFNFSNSPVMTLNELQTLKTFNNVLDQSQIVPIRSYSGLFELVQDHSRGFISWTNYHCSAMALLPKKINPHF